MLPAVLACLSFLVVGGIVGVRMLLLARRTRGTPERILGASLSALVFVTLPCVAIGFGLRLGPVWLQKTLFLVGLVPMVGFATAVPAFTAVVFRPGSVAAWSVVAAAGVVSTTGVTGTIFTRFAAWEADRVVSVHWSLLLVGTFVAGLFWTACESLSYYGKMRRRRMLGLVDPVVCNRFFLWGVGGLGAFLGIATLSVSLLLGWRLVNHPLPMFGLFGSGFSLAVTWWLAFLPPRAYLEHLRTRAVS